MSSISGPSGYQLVPLREGVDFTLYRGRQRGNSSPVLAVAVAAEQPSPQDLQRLQHEYSLASELDPAWAAKPLALTRHEGRTILVLEDPGGEPLDRVLEQNRGQPLDLTRFLCISIGLAKALGQVHRKGLIHKDIKPANVFVDDAGNVWLTGFGIASQLPHGRQVPAPPEIIAGTLAYMAPEQTGRMNRSIDTRSDLYSLGVTFYQMLTGHLPFAATDAMEWVHCHIARRPTPPDSAEFPAPLSVIIMRLLAKTVEERYQTAVGLEADLRQCLKEWETQGHIDAFPLGTHDIPDRLLIPEKLYGREREVNALLAAFDQVVVHGTTELVLVSGYSGVGKSSVVNELHTVLVPPRGLFASGKFDQYKRDIPYATLAQAFQTLVRQILVKSEAEVDQWRGALAEAVGPNGQLIVNLIPEVEFIIGKQPPVPDLPPRDAQNRFQLVFRRFLCAFARPEHPLALFLDDLQWLDAATLELLERLITDPDVRHLMLVGAYRDNEVSSSHPLLRTLEAIRKAGGQVQEIVLAPLRLDDISGFVADAMHCKAERVRPLAELLYEKTGGNPLFATQFFIALADEGLLWFDPVTRAWQWDIDGIRAKSYTDNVVGFMAGKLKRLPLFTQEALKQLACLGSVGKVATLALIQGETEEAMHAALLEAVRSGLIFQHENTYKFLHDQIQQAAYSLIPEEDRADVHLGIGRVLLASMSADQLDEHLFDVANHLNRGSELLIDHDEKARVATIDLRAGRKAKASAAFASAGAYSSAGMALLDERDWSHQYDLMFSLWLEAAECEFLTGNFDTAEQLIGKLLHRGVSKVDQAAIYHLKIQLHEVKGEYPQAVASGLACLKMFDIDLPAHPTQEQVQTEYETVWENLNGRTIESLIDLPLMTNAEVQAAMQVLSGLTPAAYFADSRLSYLQICRMVKIGMQHGASGASALACGYFGGILGPVFHRYTDGYRFAKLAGDLVEKHGFITCQAKIYHLMGHVTPWTRPIASAVEFMRATFRAAIETGDQISACHALVPLIAGFLLRNDPLEAVWCESEIALDFARRTKFRDVADIIQSQQRFIATMQGRTETFSTFNDAQFDEATFEAQLTGDRMSLLIFWYWTLKLKARFLAGDYAVALGAADKAKLQLSSSSALIHVLDYVFYSALTITACYENASTDQKQAWRELLTGYREQLREWAENYPPTFADKHALVLAEIARLEGRDPDAMRLYEQAIQSAREHGFVQNEALAHEIAARFYSARGFETIAQTYLRNARNCYDRWGALGKVRQLDERYPLLHQERVPASTTATIGTPVRQLDVETVVKASQALSSEIVLPKLIEKLMRIAIEHAGAERGLLILLRENEPHIEAEATTDHSGVNVTVRQATVTPFDLPKSTLQYVIRTRERVVLDDASVANLYSEDEYVRAKRAGSVLCVPIVKQTKLIGALYLENNLTPRAFTSDRVALLELLASQAAISLENASLYSDLQRSYSDLHRSEAFLAEGQSISHTGSFGWSVLSGELYWSEETYNIFQHDRAAKPTLELIFQRIHPDDRDLLRQTVDRVTNEKADFDIEHRLLLPEGSVKHVHVLARALETSSGNLEYVGAVTDVTIAKLAEQTLRESEAYLAEAQRLSHTGNWAWTPSTGEMRYLSEECYRVLGFDARGGQSQFKTLFLRIHPDDQVEVWEKLVRAKDERVEFELDYRIVHPDGEIRDIHVVGHPVFSPSGDLVEFVGTVMDITERKRAEEKLRTSEAHLAEAQRLSHMGSWVWRVPGRDALHLSEEWYRIYGFNPEDGMPTWEERLQRIHPEDRAKWQEAIDRAIRERSDYEVEFRILLPGGSVKYIQTVGHPVLNASGDLVQFVGSSTDITERKQAEEKIRRSEMELRHILDFAPQQIAVLGPDRTRLYVNQAALDYFDMTLEEWRSGDRRRFFHPDDWERFMSESQSKFLSGLPHEAELRLLRNDGKYRWFLFRWNPLRDEKGSLLRWYVAATDIEDRKQAEDKIRQSEMELRQILDFAPPYVAVLGPNSDRARLYANQTMLDYFGFTLEEWRSSDRHKYYHPGDWERVTSETQDKFLSGLPHEYEARFLGKDGKYRWFLFRWNPLRDEQGRVIRWYAAATDIEERKETEQRLQDENVALREEIDKASMFEEIVGTSPLLRTVLSRISKVAPIDSSVLITGETGTGKELVARAIHRRSRRSSRAFVSVNCAAIPRDLIASELFGHEKGAFTGATQRRLGRFELAEGGTIFLDEVGELPAETQIALLRVLQEHEFERVGGTGSIRTNVRVIAATNRDLEVAIAAGVFRSDLFYRLNVFPIEIPPLRQRREDIPLLVEYFIDRFSRKAGKSFQAVSKKSLDLLQSYAWPGNIRELQNIIERSVIVCDTENFSVDESWLSQQPLATEPTKELGLFKKLPSHEKAIIEAALIECGGRVYGPFGAASKLGMPRSTLESKIRSLKIDKDRFKTADPSKYS
jgi:PAS domain S-box-containing protein